MEQIVDLAATVLIVDDEPANVAVLERLLRKAGYTALISTNDPREVLSLYLDVYPDIVLLDLHMPHVDGFKLLGQLRQLAAAGSYLPVVVLTADVSPVTRERALALGASDFLTKPFDATEVLLRIKNLLQTRQLYLQLQQHNKRLEEQVQERTQDLEEARVQILGRLALAAEYRDDNTGQHTQRVGRTAALMGASLGLPSNEVTMLRRAAPLHDVGKIGIPDHVLLKAGRLSPAEFELIKTHTTIGAAILSDPEVPLLRLAETIALTHHERWDGTGYPAGLAGEDIPLSGRIVAVADVYDALTHERPYKQSWPAEAAIQEIEQQSGRQFDPAVVRCFLALARGQQLREPEELRDGVLRHAAWSAGGGAPVPAPATATPEPLERLSQRELEVLQLLAQGQTNREIAQALVISPGTVKSHVEHIIGKLGVTDRTGAAVKAFELGMLRLKTE